MVTDSTAYLPAELTGGVTVVPLSIAMGGVDGDEGDEITPVEVADALAERRVTVTTSRPPPERFARCYRAALDAGASGVVSVHLSGRLSGTHDAAVQAAGTVDPARIAVVDARSTGMALGFCVVAAAATAAAGGDLTAVRGAALAAASRTWTFFYVDTLEFLRRGGRIGAASALLGTALSVKPILHVVDGEILVRDRVRTASRGLDRLVELAVTAAGESPIDLAVHHFLAPERARAVRDAVLERLPGQVRHHWMSQVGAVVAAHVGPGLAGLVVHRMAAADRPVGDTISTPLA